MLPRKKAIRDPTDIDFVFETIKYCKNLDITQKAQVGELAETDSKGDGTGIEENDRRDDL